MLRSYVKILGVKNSHILAISVTLILACELYGSAHSAPAKKNETKDPHWWHNPCTHKTRHNRNVPENVKNIIIFSYDKLRKYETDNDTVNFTSTFPWLKPKVAKINLNVIHTKLQFYAATVYRISKMKVKSNIGKCKINNQLSELTDNLRRLLCEVETAIVNCKPETTLKRIYLNNKRIKIKNSDDCTGATLYKSVVTKSFTKFLKNLYRISKKDKGRGFCKVEKARKGKGKTKPNEK